MFSLIFNFNLKDYCSNIYDCVVEFDEEDQVTYYTGNEGYELTVNNVTIKLENPVEEFAVLKNDFIATFGIYDGSEHIISYYNKNGELVKRYSTLLDSMGKLDSMSGMYAVCSNNTLEVKNYKIMSQGTFVEEVVGTFEDSGCESNVNKKPY